MPALACLLVFMVLHDARGAGGQLPDHDRSLSVVTLNLWHDKADWPTRQDRIVRTLQTLQPDVIALQEVLQDKNLPNQAQSLATRLRYRYTFASVDAVDSARRYGNAILTRHRVVAAASRPLRPIDDYRTVAHLRLALGRRTLDVYATHLNNEASGGAIRAQQVADVANYVESTSNGGASIVLGDFNTPADAPELRALAARYRDAYDTIHPGVAQDAPEHSTLNPVFNPPLRIDHILFDPRYLRVERARRVFEHADRHGAWASDHFGVMAVLRFVEPDARSREAVPGASH